MSTFGPLCSATVCTRLVTVLCEAGHGYPAHAMPLERLFHKATERTGLPSEEAKERVLTWLARVALLAGDQERFTTAYAVAKAEAAQRGAANPTGRDLRLALLVIRARAEKKRVAPAHDDDDDEPHPEAEARPFHASTEACDGERRAAASSESSDAPTCRTAVDGAPNAPALVRSRELDPADALWPAAQMNGRKTVLAPTRRWRFSCTRQRARTPRAPSRTATG